MILFFCLTEPRQTAEMPDGASLGRHTFDTLARERAFKSPSTTGSTVPILNEFVAPHIESFNALFDDSGLAPGDGDGRGLLSLAIRDIGERVVFDGAGPGSGQKEWGNRLSSKNLDSL
jgi:DNA-directed RNA polymerase I subunit RPA2